MRKHNPENELAKREYLAWLGDAKGRSPATLNMVAAALHRFEAFNRYKAFKTFRREQASSFKAHLTAQKNGTTGKPLSKATLYSTLNILRAFFEWLSREPGYRKTLVFSDAEYFNLIDNDARIATASRQRPAPSLDQVRFIVETMPSATVIERRDRAVVALIMLTGARDAAVASLQLKHLDLATRTLFQDARAVKTKRAKTIEGNFFPVGEPFETVVKDWVDELQRDYMYGPDDPLFPATRIGIAKSGLFGAEGIERRHWTTASPIRYIFRRGCEAACLPYYNPHSLRRTLVRLAYDRNVGQREMKAWSECLGHSSITTTMGSYGALSAHERAEVMAGLAKAGDNDDKTLEAMANQLAQIARSRRA